MNVLSLFDGMSGGMVALERVGIKVDKYFASEIDKYAIKISKKNYPNIIHIGDVRNVSYKNEILYTELGEFETKIDLLIGGSPCQGFSFAGKQLNFEDPRSKLFFEYSRILDEIKKENNNIKFILENVVMKKQHQDIITKIVKHEPILINSSLVSAQNRKRLYWTNIKNLEQPKDKNIFLKEVIESGNVDRQKSYCIDANYYKGGSLKNYIEKKRRQIIFNISPNFHQSEKRLMVLENSNNYYEKIKEKNNINDEGFEKQITFRMLTPTECETLQTLPRNYTEGVSNSQRYKMIGNGWTIDVIAHILKNIKEDYE